MTTPAYHLRPNKAIDRMVMVEAIRRLEQIAPLNEYTYYGLGGPYLEDFRVLYEHFKDIKMVSIERDPHVLKRQRFHLPCKTMCLREADFKDFLDYYDPGDDKCIFWVDYTNIIPNNFEQFQTLLGKVADGSLVKVTMRSKLSDFTSDSESFRERFQKFMNEPEMKTPESTQEYAIIVQDMLQIAAEQELPYELGRQFLPIGSFLYSDGTHMLTLMGIVCPNECVDDYRDLFGNWEFRNLDWGAPRQIDVPTLSTKERLMLQDKIPVIYDVGDVLYDALGYNVNGNEASTKRQLEQYAAFHRQYPYFMRTNP